MPKNFYQRLTFLKVALSLFSIILSNYVCASTITIGRFGGVNTNITFDASTRTWTPSGSAASQLDSDLLTQSLNEGDVTINTAGPGDISFTPGTFVYSAPAARTLQLVANGNVTAGKMGTGGAPVNFLINATGDVSIGPEGVYTNGGYFTAAGANFTVTGTELATQSGNVNLSIVNTINLFGGGVVTAGGSFTSSSVHLNLFANPLNTGTGDISMSHSGVATIDAGGITTTGGSLSFTGNNLIIRGSGLKTGGGNFEFRGNDLTITQAGMATNGGNVTIAAAGNVDISWEGVRTGTLQLPGGNFISSGVTFSAIGGGVQTFGGDVQINHTGNVTAGNLLTAGGNYFSKGNALAVRENGIATSGGKVTFAHQGSVTVNDNGVRTGGGNFASSGSGTFTTTSFGIDVGNASTTQIVHAGIFLNGSRFNSTNPEANILMHASCNDVAVASITANGSLRILGDRLSIRRIEPNGQQLNVTLTAASDIELTNSISSNSGDVVINTLGEFRLVQNTNSSDDPDGIITSGGNIEIRSAGSITSANTPGFNTTPGTGGIMTQTGSENQILLAGSPILGGGNISLIIDPELTIPFGPGKAEICNGIDDNCDGIIDDGVASCDPLPVKLIGFQASKDEQSILLHWTTAEEFNSEMYVIERSLNGRKWTAIGNVKASGMSSATENYLFYDHAPVNGNNIYRLKMVDLDGSFTYSAIRNVNFKKKAEQQIVIYPNPVVQHISIQLKDFSQVKSIQLIGANGHVVETIENLASEFEIKSQVPGIYILRLTLQDGSMLSRKFIKK